MDLPSSMIAPELEDLTICSFCHLPFNSTDAVPKLFACRHFFCLKCVNLMLRDGSDDIYCVHCWKRTELQGPEPKADNLPTYNAILNLSRNLNTFSPEDNNATTTTTKTTNTNEDSIQNNGNDSGNCNGLNNHYHNNHHHHHHHHQQQQQQQQQHRNVGIIGQLTTTTSTSATNAGGSCIIEIDDRDRSPSISSSNGSATGSSLVGSIGGNSSVNGTNNNNNHSHKLNNMMNCGGGNVNGGNGNGNGIVNGGGGGGNNDFGNNCNIEKLKIGENCLTHAMPNTLWCSICRIQLCRACAGSEEHHMHPVKNQLEAKESLHNDISNELQTMQQTLNDLQQLLQKQRDFLIKILESCTTLKTQIETELVNPMPNCEIAEIRERLAKAHICLELLEKQTPGDALKLYTTLHTERQRLLGKYQEMFLQCKLDDLIKGSGFVFDFDLIKKALIRLHNCIVSGDVNVANMDSLGVPGFDICNGNGGMVNGLNSINHNPILILANYCISQLYSRQMLAIKQQQQQQQQQQHKQIQQQQHHKQLQQQTSMQLMPQQMMNANNMIGQQQHQMGQHHQQHYQQNNQIQHQNHQQQQQQQQQSLLPSALLNTMIAHAGLNSIPIANANGNQGLVDHGATTNSTNNNNNKNINNNKSNSDTNLTHTTYAQALQQSAVSAQKNAQHISSPIGKTYADIINNANNSINNNKRNLHSPISKQHHQHALEQAQQHKQQQRSNTNGNVPELAPIGTKTALAAATSSSSSSSIASSSPPSSSSSSLSSSAAAAAAITNGKKFNVVNLNFLHLQQHPTLSQSQSTAKQQQQQAVIPSKSPLAHNPRIHIYPIYFFNIEMNGKPAGRLLIEVRSDMAPKMAKNFNALVTQEFGFGYKGCQVFQCWENESIITGDYELNNGRGGRSVLDEPYFMPDDTKILAIRGSVGMRRSQKRHDNMGLVGSQFRIILREMRGFTGIFGFLIDGIDVVERIAQTGDSSGKPQSNIVITNCGKYEMS